MNIAVSTQALSGTASSRGVPGPARPSEAAHIIRDDAEAIRVAHALAASSGARDHWDRFPPSARKQMLSWIVQAKRPATRAARVEETATRAARGERSR